MCNIGVEVVEVDFDKPETLTRAFQNISRLLIISTNAFSRGPQYLFQPLHICTLSFVRNSKAQMKLV